MTTKSRKNSAGKGKAQPPAFVSRYIGIDSHLTERNGSTDQVYGLAAERPAGRKLADDIARHCVQLDADDYDVISIFPLVSGRITEAQVESDESVSGRTYSKQLEIEQDENTPPFFYGKRYENKHYVDTGIGYSVTDGVIIIAKLR